MANSTKVVTGKVRLSYANLFQPRSQDGQDPKYGTALLIPKNDKETIAKIKAAIEAVKADPAALAKWGGKVPPNLSTPLRDGDIDRPDDPVYAGCFFVNASSKQKPGVVDKDLNPIFDANEVYSGCYARASVNFFGYAVSGKKGVGCGLNNVQKIADGDVLGGRARPEDDFEKFEETDW
jgi:hypothetical protein